MHPRAIFGIFGCLYIGGLLAPTSSEGAASVEGFLKEHCIQCHNEEKAKGDLRLDNLKPQFDKREMLTAWQHVLEKMETGEMPPKSKPRPPAQDLRKAADWIAEQVKVASAKLRETEGRVVLRRLNRNEYENTVRDLLGVEVKLRELLPQDAAAAGFDNVGDALHTSSFLLAKYLEAAEEALNQAIVNRPEQKSATKRVTLNDAYQVRSSKESVFRKQDDGSVVMFSSSKWVGATLFYMEQRGRYRFRMQVRGVQSAGKPVTFEVQSGGGGMGGPKSRLAGYFDAPADKERVIEFEDRLEPRTSIFILPYALPNAQTVSKTGQEAWKGPGLQVDWVEMEGPLNESWPPPSHMRLFGDLQQGPFPGYNMRDRVEVVSEKPEADARRLLGAFARRAFRRKLDAEEVEPFVALVLKRLGRGTTFEQAMRAGFAGIMTSPEFLFLREEPGRLDEFALASRLSYFLWSSMPDDELLDLAEKKKLGEAMTLHTQVERMLKDKKAAAFTENFTGQWLAMRDLDFTEPSARLYPEFDDMLRASMLREVQLFFDELLKNDLSIVNFLSSDFTMLNGRLAKHYGIPDVDGWEFQRVKLPPDSHRGGLLTMAGVLKVTANGTNTSPVTRGAWVLDRIFGTPPKPPPPSAGTIEPDIRGATTIREQLAKHRSVESCASCHVSIDPPGFALENFDVIGGWREFYRTTGNGKPVMMEGRRMPYLEGKAVDAGDVTPDGKRFKNIDEYKALLIEEKDKFARGLATKLAIYATGGLLEATDLREINAIVERTQAKGSGFRRLIHELVQSVLFQTK
ncbi:DUF1592 domain-containing protein [Prosthecobacter sp.]|uniref:DUF1592 domain-containing protein n=1 Tax=Prosthecobacter sp. TaxID=1965333 RepID=UPI00378451CA